MHRQPHDELHTARYALLRTFRGDGTPVDTPVWFAVDGTAVLFRTKVGPKTRRLTQHPRVELTACDYRGRPGADAAAVSGSATILTGAAADRANDLLCRRYGWQWNLLPMVPLPGVVNVHRDLPLREKLRRVGHRGVWPDSVMVRVDIE